MGNSNPIRTLRMCFIDKKDAPNINSTKMAVGKFRQETCRLAVDYHCEIIMKNFNSDLGVKSYFHKIEVPKTLRTSLK